MEPDDHLPMNSARSPPTPDVTFGPQPAHRCHTGDVTTNDIYERLGALEQLVRHLYAQNGIPVPDVRSMAQSQVSDRVLELLASGNKIAAVKAYRDEAGVDLPTATRVIESL